MYLAGPLCFPLPVAIYYGAPTVPFPSALAVTVVPHVVQVLQWLGGLGILVLATAVLSECGVSGAQLMETEIQTRNVNKLTSNIAATAQLIWGLYIGLTLLTVAVYDGLHLLNLKSNMECIYATFPRSTRDMMVFLVRIGRIEIIPDLVLFTKALWVS